MLIEGIEDALVGLEEEDSPTVAVPPEKGYGEGTETRVQEFETGELRDMVGGQALEEGASLEAQNGQPGEITHRGGSQ